MKLINKKICMGRDIGVHGNVFGGILMAWIDEAAGAYASEYCQTPNLVTLRVGELLFKRPLKAGNHLRIYGEVDHVGKTSITLKVEARRYNLYDSEETVVCTTSMTFVRIDEDGQPTAIGESVRQKYAAEIKLDDCHLN